jgi:hypothetical protein
MIVYDQDTRRLHRTPPNHGRLVGAMSEREPWSWLEILIPAIVGALGVIWMAQLVARGVVR